MDERNFQLSLHLLKDRISLLSTKYANQDSIPCPSNNHRNDNRTELELAQIQSAQLDRDTHTKQTPPPLVDINRLQSNTSSKEVQSLHSQQPVEPRLPSMNSMTLPPVSGFGSWPASSEHPEPRRSQRRSAPFDEFSLQLNDLKAHLDRIEGVIASYHHEQQMQQLPSPQSSHVRSSGAWTSDGLPPMAQGASWSPLTAMQNEVQSLCRRFAGLETAVHDVGLEVDHAMHRIAKFTPPASVASTQDESSTEDPSSIDGTSVSLKTALHGRNYDHHRPDLSTYAGATELRSRVDYLERTNAKLRASNEAFERKIEQLGAEACELEGATNTMEQDIAFCSCANLERASGRAQEPTQRSKAGTAREGLEMSLLDERLHNLEEKSSKTEILANLTTVELNALDEQFAAKSQVESLEWQVAQDMEALRQYKDVVQQNKQAMAELQRRVEDGEQRQLTIEAQFVQCEKLAYEAMGRISYDRDEQVRQLHESNDQNYAVIYRQEQILKRGAQLMEEKDEEIDRLSRQLGEDEKALEYENDRCRNMNSMIEQLQAHNRMLARSKSDGQDEMHRLLAEKDEALTQANSRLHKMGRVVENLEAQLRLLTLERGTTSKDIQSEAEHNRLDPSLVRESEPTLQQALPLEHVDERQPANTKQDVELSGERQYTSHGREPQDVGRGHTMPRGDDRGDNRRLRHRSTRDHWHDEARSNRESRSDVRHHRRSRPTERDDARRSRTQESIDIQRHDPEALRQPDERESKVKYDMVQARTNGGESETHDERPNASQSQRHRTESGGRLWWPPLPAPVQEETVHKARSMLDLRSVPRSSRQGSLAKHQSMQRLPRQHLQAYVETEAETESDDRGGERFRGDV